MKEAKLKSEIVRLLNLHGYFVWINRNVGVYNAKYGKYIPSPVKGVPDIIGLTPDGRFIGIEVKSNKYNKPTIHQQAFLEQINKLGGIGVVMYSIDDAIKFLETHKTNTNT